MINGQWLLKNALPSQGHGEVKAEETDENSDNEDEKLISASTTGDVALVAKIKAHFDTVFAMITSGMDDLKGWVTNFEKDVAMLIEFCDIDSFITIAPLTRVVSPTNPLTLPTSPTAGGTKLNTLANLTNLVDLSP